MLNFLLKICYGLPYVYSNLHTKNIRRPNASVMQKESGVAMKANFRWIHLIFVAYVMGAAGAFSFSEARSADVTVGSGCTYATIADAIAAAGAGERLLLEGGVTFNENVVISNDLTLEGGYAGCDSGSQARTTINGGGSGSVVIIDPDISAALSNLNLTNGNTTGEGGGIRLARGTGGGTLDIENVDIYGNAALWGGGLWVGAGASATGENVHIYNNTASAFGGGVRLYGGNAAFTDSSIHENTSPMGGGVYATRELDSAPALNLTSSSDIYANAAQTGDGFGGGVYMSEGTISLAGGSTIDGNSATAGGGAYLITSTLTISGETSMIMRNTATGNGGGVYAEGSAVNLDDSAALYNNTAGGSGGGAYLDSSSLWGDKALLHHNAASSYGGGVYAVNSSTVDMDLGAYPCFGRRCSQLSDNTATTGYGGGVYASDSTVDLRQTFVEGNASSIGGGIYAYQSNVALYNVLVAGNNATGGTGHGVRLYTGASLSGAHNTFAHNDAGGATAGRAIDIYDATLTLTNSIVWGHASSINDSMQDVTCSNIQGGYAGTDNLDMDPQFVDPADADFRLKATSPVIDRCTTGESLDFENESRPTMHIRPATPYDIGADEFSLPRVGINGGGCIYGTLTQAIAAAEDGDTIQVAEGTFFEGVDISSKDLIIAGGYDSTCTTPGWGATILDARYHPGSVVDIGDSTVTLRDLQITGGSATGGGVEAASAADVTLDNTRITGNTGSYGAGLYVGISSAATLTNGTKIDYNSATVSGGGVRVWGQLIVDSSAVRISNNSAPSGGGIAVPGGTFQMSAGWIQYNQANAADGCGGGIYADGSGVVMLSGSSSISSNSAYNGAGICADNVQLNFQGLAIYSNAADNNGGGVYLVGGSILNASDTTLGENYAGNYGGAIYADEGALDVAYTYLYNNIADRGGAIYQTGEGPTANVSNSLIYSNTSIAGLGGGIRSEGGTVTMTHVTLANNINGAGYSQSNTDGYVTNSIAWGNDAGGFWITSGTLDGTCNIDQSGNAGQNIDPMFVSPGGGENYRLLSNSPAIDACTTGLPLDLDKVPRPIFSRYDMGAYEYYVTYDVEAVSNPPDGGTASGAGTYYIGSNVTVNASADPGYVFVHWSSGDTIVSLDTSYSFSAAADVTLQASFSQEQSEYLITASGNTNHGTVSGESYYNHGADATVTAYPNSGYVFSHWMETWDGFQGSFIVSTEEMYTFTANRVRQLTAVFRPNILPGVMMLLLEDE